MKRDRADICTIMSEMFDNVGDCGIYPTGVAYDKLELVVVAARIEAIGWAHAECCGLLDAGRDPRKQNMNEVLSKSRAELS